MADLLMQTVRAYSIPAELYVTNSNLWEAESIFTDMDVLTLCQNHLMRSPEHWETLELIENG
jgi:hypothetical protein